MRYCRSCGSALAPSAGSPALAGRPGPAPTNGPMPGMGAGPLEPTAVPAMPPPSSPASLGMMPASLATPVLRAQGGTIACPRCGTQTPLGFAYCQQCGLHMQALQPTDPAVAARPGGRSAPAGPGWGTAVLVNRDGSDGQRYPLDGEYLVVGRAGSDIAFDDDRFLARQHARIERGDDGIVKVHPLDTLNGVFRKADTPVELVDGVTILVGREVLRYERVEPEESKVHPLVRHGVALFGSPSREPWGRFVQLVPSGSHRDVRHLAGEEVVLGREEGEIVFRDDAFMSRRHAAATWDGKRAQITDLGSSNGTFVRITGPTALKHGDHVRLGDQLLRIELGS